MRSFLAGLADLVFPPRCASCSGKLEDGAHFSLCEGCRSGIGIIHSPLCTVCGEPFASDAEKDHPCGSAGRPSSVRHRTVPGDGSGSLMTMIHRLNIGSVPPG